MRRKKVNNELYADVRTADAAGLSYGEYKARRLDIALKEGKKRREREKQDNHGTIDSAIESSEVGA